MLTGRHLAAACLTVAVAIPVLAACSSAGSSPAPAVSSQATPQASPTAGSDPSSWAPIMIDKSMSGTVIEMQVGQQAVFTDLPLDDGDKNNIVAESNNPDVVMAVESTPQTLDGLIAVRPGVGVVTVWDGYPADGDAIALEQVTVRVTNEKDADDIWDAAPVVVGSQKSLTVKSGQLVKWEGFPFAEGYSVSTTNDMIAVPWTMDDTDKDAGFTAVGPGVATVEVMDDGGKTVSAVNVTVTP